jgi:hypothetical protein
MKFAILMGAEANRSITQSVSVGGDVLFPALTFDPDNGPEVMKLELLRECPGGLI